MRQPELGGGKPAGDSPPQEILIDMNSTQYLHHILVGYYVPNEGKEKNK
jgi:hypothetical protein